MGSGTGQVVKLLACGVSGPGFHSRSRHLNFRDWEVADTEGAEGMFAPPPPPPPKIGPKKREEVFYFRDFSIFGGNKMQNFLGSLRSPALFNIVINITLLKNLENNTC